MDHSAERHFDRSADLAVLLVDEDPEFLQHIRGIVQGIGCTVHACRSYSEGIHRLEARAFDVIVVGQGSRNFEGRSVLQHAVGIDRRLPVIVVARHLEMECYLEAMHLGAADYVSPGASGSELTFAMRANAPVRRAQAAA